MLPSDESQQILAIDLGLRCGYSIYGADGRLRSYSSQQFAGIPQMRRTVAQMLAAAAPLTWLFTEGDLQLAAIWEREAMRQGIRVQRVSVDTWRDALLLPNERRTAASARRQAGVLARRVIDWSGAIAPAALRHDAAAAILIGLWAVQRLGWLEALPEAMGQVSRPGAVARRQL